MSTKKESKKKEDNKGPLTEQDFKSQTLRPVSRKYKIKERPKSTRAKKQAPSVFSQESHHSRRSSRLRLKLPEN